MTTPRDIDYGEPAPEPAWADNIGTSTSDDEAALREIGRTAFGIRYPRDITPKKRLSPHK